MDHKSVFTLKNKNKVKTMFILKKEKRKKKVRNLQQTSVFINKGRENEDVK